MLLLKANKDHENYLFCVIIFHLESKASVSASISNIDNQKSQLDTLASSASGETKTQLENLSSALSSLSSALTSYMNTLPSRFRIKRSTGNG